MHFTKFSAILKCFKCGGHCNIKRFKATLNEPCDVLVNRLGITKEAYTKLVKKHQLHNVTGDHLVEVLDALKSLGYKPREILDYASILKWTANKVQDRRILLEEAGFSDLSLLILTNFRKHVNKKISVLKHLNFIPPHINVPEKLIMHLHPKPVDFFTDDYNEEHIFGQVHSGIMKRYLQWRLEASQDEIETFFRIYSPFLKFKGFEHLCANIEIALDLGFTPRKILSFGYILGANPDYARTVLRDMPNFAGADMRTVMRRYPKLVTVSPKQYIKIYKILQEEEIPDSSICRQMNIFTLSTDTIKLRFNELKHIPEMNVLKQNPKILKLIIHYNRARSRLSFMHQLQLKCASMCILDSEHENNFETRIRNSKDTNVLKDVVALLEHLLNTDASHIEFNLRKHPYHLHVPLINIEKTCTHMKKKFSNISLTKVAPILLYPSEKIDAALEEVSLIKDLPVRLSDAKKLNLALYLIEKNYHFSGDGVWEDSGPLQA